MAINIGTTSEPVFAWRSLIGWLQWPERRPVIKTGRSPDNPLNAGYEAVERLHLLDLGWQPPLQRRRR